MLYYVMLSVIPSWDDYTRQCWGLQATTAKLVGCPGFRSYDWKSAAENRPWLVSTLVPESLGKVFCWASAEYSLRVHIALPGTLELLEEHTSLQFLCLLAMKVGGQDDFNPESQLVWTQTWACWAGFYNTWCLVPCPAKGTYLVPSW